jgi:hypothetical protein
VALGVRDFGEPLLQMLSARHWRGASCEIISSSVNTRQTGDRSTYRVAVTYRYFVDDREYVGERYQFTGSSSAGYGGNAAIVARLSPETLTECWVPRRPQVAPRP